MTKKCASPALRHLRRAARIAGKAYMSAARLDGNSDVTNAARREWHALSARCRSTSKALRRGFCTRWTDLWDELRRAAPRKLWKTFRTFTDLPHESSTCSPDAQWNHWA
eukprot:2738481-Karenia_brevis.AAC.1